MKQLQDDKLDQPAEEDALAAPAKIKPLTPTPDAGAPAAGLPQIQAAPPPAIPAETTPTAASVPPAVPAVAPAPAPAPTPTPTPYGTATGAGAPDQTLSYGYSGSAANLFPGADGKGLTTGGASPGQFWQAFDQSQAAPLDPAEKAKAEAMMRGDQSLMNQYKQQYGANWLQQWGADQDKYAERLRNQTASASDINNLKGKSATDAWAVISGANNPSGANYMNALRAMTSDQRKQFLDQWPEGTRDRAIMEGSLAAQGITVDKADTGQRWDGKTQNNGPMASAIPVYSQGVQGSGVNSQGLAGFGTPSAPSSPATAGQAPPAPAGTLPGVAPAPAGAPAAATGTPTEAATATPNKVATSTAPASSPATSTAAGGLPGVTASPSGAFTATPTDPNDSLLNKTLDYGPLTDRFKVAQSELENWDKTSNPQFQADLRDAMRKAAAGGALGSGMLQTSLGDITANRELQRQGQGTSFLNNALTGSIQDAKDRANFAAGQQGFQAGQQQTAFGQGVTEAQLNEALTNGSFQRALQSLLAGSNGNPADIQLALSQIFGNQASNAGNALGGLIQNKTANSTNTGTNSYLGQLLAGILGGNATTATG